MNDDQLNEIIEELRKQNAKLEKLVRKQSEMVWYVWLTAMILIATVVLPVVFRAIGMTNT